MILKEIYIIINIMAVFYSYSNNRDDTRSTYNKVYEILNDNNYK